MADEEPWLLLMVLMMNIPVLWCWYRVEHEEEVRRSNGIDFGL